jgi:hypothetical protein
LWVVAHFEKNESFPTLPAPSDMERRLLLKTIRDLRTQRECVQAAIDAIISTGEGSHLTDHDLERYHLGMVTDETELARIEEHYLGCPECAERAEGVADYVDMMRAAAIKGNWDLA